MKNLLGALSLLLGLAVAACGSPDPGPDYPSPEPGRLPGQQYESGAMDLDALAGEDESDEMAENDVAEAEEPAGEGSEASGGGDENGDEDGDGSE